MRPARVLHVAKVKGIGGCERHLLTLLPSLSATGMAVRLLVLEAGEDERRFVAQAWDAGIDMERAPAGADGDPRAISAVTAAIRRFSPDVVHTHLIHADLWGQLAARRAGVPGVRSLHNVMPAYRRAPAGQVGRMVGRLATRSIAISSFVAAYARRFRLAPADRIRVVPYGVDVDSWAVTDEERVQERQRLDLADEDVVVGMASRLIDGKGHAMAVDAMGRARGAVPELRMMIAGEGPLRPSLERGASALTARASFLGQVDDMPRFMGACDLLLFPTLPGLGEGFGLAALEAMAAGVPVVATGVGALPEVVEHGVTGSVVGPSAEAIAAALVRLGGDRDERASMGKAGCERAATTFGIDAMVARTVDVYREATA
jgi:glycosyltransferase involved in cell wall biosynthesis